MAEVHMTAHVTCCDIRTASKWIACSPMPAPHSSSTLIFTFPKVSRRTQRLSLSEPESLGADTGAAGEVGEGASIADGCRACIHSRPADSIRRHLNGAQRVTTSLQYEGRTASSLQCSKCQCSCICVMQHPCAACLCSTTLSAVVRSSKSSRAESMSRLTLKLSNCASPPRNRDAATSPDL